MSDLKSLPRVALLGEGQYSGQILSLLQPDCLLKRFDCQQPKMASLVAQAELVILAADDFSGFKALLTDFAPFCRGDHAVLLMTCGVDDQCFAPDVLRKCCCARRLGFILPKERNVLLASDFREVRVTFGLAMHTNVGVYMLPHPGSLALLASSYQIVAYLTHVAESLAVAKDEIMRLLLRLAVEVQKVAQGYGWHSQIFTGLTAWLLGASVQSSGVLNLAVVTTLQWLKQHSQPEETPLVNALLAMISQQVPAQDVFEEFSNRGFDFSYF